MWQRILCVGLLANLGQCLRNIDPKFVRRRVHASVETGAAVMTQVGQVHHIRHPHPPPPLQRRKHRTIPLTIPTSVTNLELPEHRVADLQSSQPPPPSSLTTLVSRGISKGAKHPWT